MGYEQRAGRRRRRLLVGVAILLVVTLVPMQRAAAATVFRVHTWNLAMGNASYNRYDETILLTVDFVRTFPAWQVSLQEACQGQANEIVYALNSTGAGLASYFGRASGGAVACQDGQGPYGNSIMAIGNFIGPHYHAFTTRPPGITEDKNIACLTMQNFGFNTTNCTTHLQPGGSLYTLAQMDIARQKLAQFGNPWGPVQLIGADFNYNYNPPVSDDAVQFRDWHRDHNEAWVPYERLTIVSGDMIDFIWGNAPNIQPNGRYGCTFHTSVSDHGICPAVFKL